MKKCFAYLRVSTAKQLDGSGLDRQEEIIRKFADTQGWVVARTIEDQQSGATEYWSRGKMHEMLELAGKDSAAGVSAIIVERADRIARDLIVQELFLKDCKDRGIEVYAADCGEELVKADSDPTRKLIRQILGALAEWDKAQIQRKLLAGRKRKKLQTGEPCGGPKPYENTPEGRTAVRLIKRLRDSNYKVTEIRQYLYDAEVKSRYGNAWWAESSIYAVINKQKQEHE